MDFKAMRPVATSVFALAVRIFNAPQVACDAQRNGSSPSRSICRAIEVGGAAVSGIAALEQLCEKCKKGAAMLDADPCSNMSEAAAKAALGKNRFKLLTNELEDIQTAVRNAIREADAADGGSRRLEELGTVLRIVSTNLRTMKGLKMNELNFDTDALERGLLQHREFLNDAAQQLEMRIQANGHNHGDALVLHLKNPTRDAVTLELPAGALFQPTKDKSSQNLVLAMTTRLTVSPGESKSVGLRAFCGNSNKRSPYGQMSPTDFVLNCDLKSQSSVWSATSAFER